MSYAIAPTFEGNRMGVRRLRTLSGMRGGVPLGDAATDSYVQMLVASGYNANDINTLVAGGATVIDLGNLLNGNATMDALLAKLYPASGGAGINPAIPPQAPAPPQIPTGSTLTYSVTWSFGLNNVSNSSAIASLQSSLPAYGMSVIAGTPYGGGILGYGIQVTIKDNVGHALLTDAKSVLDSLMRNLVGTNVTGSNLTISAVPGQPLPSGTPGAPGDLSTWFMNNWGYLAGALAAIVILPPLIKKL